MRTIDLNADVGELGELASVEEELLEVVTSVNVACGGHAGDEASMERVVRAALARGVAIGAHPSYPDRAGFGRRAMSLPGELLAGTVAEQVASLLEVAARCGARLTHVKPHGALYNMAAKDAALAKAICEGIREIDAKLILLALSGSAMITAAKEMGLSCASEVFADRAYMPDGTLVPRSSPDAMIQDDQLAITRTVQMAVHGKVTALDGIDIAIEADSVCVHGDNAQALTFVRHIRTALETAKVRISTL